MSPLDRLAVCAGKILAQIEMWFPGFDDDVLESDYDAAVARAEAALVETEAETEVHEPAPRTVDNLGIDERGTVWKSVVGTIWRWNSGRWWYSHQDGWTMAPHDYWPRATSLFTAVDPQFAAMDWHGWAVPAILEVLAENEFEDHYAIDTESWSEWADGVALLIADRIACDPQRAIEALSHDRISR